MVYDPNEYKSKRLSYPYDEDGWIWIKDSYPKKQHCFEIVLLKFEDKFIQTMWWTGQIWDGAQDLHDSKPIKWRFKT